MIGDGVYEPGGTTVMEGNGNGDLIRAVLNGAGTGWNFVTSEATNGTEFFGSDSFGSLHEETSMGGLAVHHGANLIINTVMDPVNNLSGGFDWTRSSDGGLDRSYEIDRRSSGGSLTAHMVAKANALGEIELLSDAAPVEIGNRIWNDADLNGMQGAGETGLSNITVELYADFNNDGTPDGPVLASIITNASGEWYFNNSNIIDGDPIKAGNQPGLKFGAAYIVRIGAADWDGTGGIGTGDLNRYLLTLTDATGPGMSDASDNDATLTSGGSKMPQIRFTAGLAGQNNHNLDFGFIYNPLPLTLISFTAQLNNTDQVSLKWTTVTEVKVSHFEIERSTDGINFFNEGIVFARGNATDITNYTMLNTIDAARSSIYYYRLRSVDIDGKSQLSDIRIIRIGLQSGNNMISTYPNPAKNELRISVTANWQGKKIVYEMFNATGQVTKRMETASSSKKPRRAYSAKVRPLISILGRPPRK